MANIDIKDIAVTMLASVNVPLNANGNTTLFTVPAGKRCVLSHAVVIAGSDAGTTTLSIGASGTSTDFVPNNTLSNLDAQYDAVIIRPVPNTTPLKSKSYAAATVIVATVGSQAGGATNTLKLFGILYDV